MGFLRPLRTELPAPNVAECRPGKRSASRECGIWAGNAGYRPGKRSMSREFRVRAGMRDESWKCGLEARCSGANGQQRAPWHREPRADGAAAAPARCRPSFGSAPGSAAGSAPGPLPTITRLRCRLRFRPAAGPHLALLPALSRLRSRPRSWLSPGPAAGPHPVRCQPRVTVKANQPMEHNEGHPKGAAEEPKRRWSRTSSLSLGRKQTMCRS